MFVKTLVTTLCIIGVVLAEQSPVFLWGVEGPSKPTLQDIPETEFNELIKSYLKDHMVVAFEEDSLNAKDFLCSNAETSMSCYAYLQGIETKSYYASVSNPVEAIRNAATEREHNSVNKEGQLERSIDCEAGKAVFINFEDDQTESREARLETHDVAINSISKSFTCPTVFLYLATPSTSLQKRSRRRAQIYETAAPVGGTYFRSGNQFLIFYTHLHLYKTNGDQPEEIILNSMQISNGTNTKMFNVSHPTNKGNSLTYNITYSNDGYYTMSNIVYDGVEYRVNEANAPTTFSYHCGNMTAYCIPNIKAGQSCSTFLKWNSLQFQAPFNPKTQMNFIFDDSWDCVPFFTPGILMGLFVLIFLLVITSIGICWMMDINTMDRFDDPKGKTITINASE